MCGSIRVGNVTSVEMGHSRSEVEEKLVKRVGIYLPCI